MQIERIEFEKVEVEVTETYIDEDGRVRERTKKILVPTGNCLPEEKKEG